MRVIVYTCLFGGYDQSPPLLEPEPGVEYIMFTDWETVPAPWTTRRSVPLYYVGQVTPRRLSRMPKILAHQFLPAHDISIYCDASLQFKQPFVDWAVAQVAIEDIAAPPHPKTQCIYDEAEKCIRLGLDYQRVVKEHMQRNRARGFPRHQGLTENSFIIRRNCDWVRAFNHRWSDEYHTGSQRDQLSFMFTLWEMGRLSSLRVLPVHARENQFWSQTKHLKTRVVCKPPN